MEGVKAESPSLKMRPPGSATDVEGVFESRSFRVLLLAPEICSRHRQSLTPGRLRRGALVLVLDLSQIGQAGRRLSHSWSAR